MKEVVDSMPEEARGWFVPFDMSLCSVRGEFE